MLVEVLFDTQIANFLTKCPDRVRLLKFENFKSHDFERQARCAFVKRSVVDRSLFLRTYFYVRIVTLHTRRSIRNIVVFTATASDSDSEIQHRLLERWSRQQYKILKVVGHRC